MQVNRVTYYTTIREKGEAIKSLSVDGYRVYKVEKVKRGKVFIKACRLNK